MQQKFSSSACLDATSCQYRTIRNRVTSGVITTAAKLRSKADAKKSLAVQSADDSQQWKLAEADSGFVKIVSKQSGKVLEFVGTNNDENVMVSTYNGDQSQQFKVEKDGEFYIFKPRQKPELCLRMSNDLWTENAPLQLIQCTSINLWSRHWVLEACGGKKITATVRGRLDNTVTTAEYI